MKIVESASVLSVCLSVAAALTWIPTNCSRQGLACTSKSNNCMDREWLNVNTYTPSSPEELEVAVDNRQDGTGSLQPVLLANWKISNDGSISHLRATELHVLVMSTNQNLCVRYSFKDQLKPRTLSQEKWSFSAMMTLDPGQSYRVSVFNIPKPELDHSNYDVSAVVHVPGCQDPTMKMTEVCIEIGSLWQPNISLAQVTAVTGRTALVVSFSPDRLCEDYTVLLKCSTSTSHLVGHLYKANQTFLNVTFSLDEWPRSCCQFDAEIKPLFPKCGQDCERQKKTLDICPPKPPDVRDGSLCTYIALAVVCMCVVIAVVIYVLCRKPVKPGVDVAPVGGEIKRQLNQPSKVLIIYSQDHHLHRDIVLKLCAFLQDKCGTKVLVDLLDTALVGMVGRLRWLEWQRQQLKNPTDKILVLCSRGVQAKWRAMCGQGHVTLKEDILSPTDDMLTPFLNLFLPDMYQAGMLGKYMVAYFDDISSEEDIPSVFDIAVKYKLMKHFEELYFRILDMEKYQPGQVNHIEGIGGDEYFNCSSGRALQNAIETFHAYQLGNPDWFEKQCVGTEEELIPDSNLAIDQFQIPQVLENVPLIRYGPPVYTHEVEINNGNSVIFSTPKLNTDQGLSFVAELKPVVNPRSEERSLQLDEELTDHQYPHCPSPESVYISEPVFSNPPPQTPNWLSIQEEPSGQIPTEDEENDSLLPMSQISARLDEERSSVPQNSPDSSHVNMQSEYFPSSKTSHSAPLELEPYEVQEPSGKGHISGSDQGYISKLSSQNEAPFKEDPLLALRRLQEELIDYSDIEEN